jgi:alpha-glucosidase (family GH31 glycosyl hydrolase)
MTNNLDTNLYLVSAVLPEPYFEWSTGKLVSGNLQYWMEPQTWPIFVKYGSILPLLNLNECLSLEDCYENSLTIQVWGEEAEGLLYVDDGISLPVYGNLFQFAFESGILYVTCLQNDLGSRAIEIS